MIIFQLFYRFFLTGLFSIGGGLATLPFLEKMGEATSWFTHEELTQIFAISESTPGPIGVNMAVYIGFNQAGFFGSLAAVVGLILPSVIIIIIISKILSKFKESRVVKSMMIGLKICSIALITSALVTLSLGVFFSKETSSFNYTSIVIALTTIALLSFKKIKDLHPIFIIILGAIFGIILY